MAKIMSVPVEKIKVGDHAQRMEGEDEGIEELARSIARIGLLVPLVVCGGPDSYVVIAGHRRLAACQIAGRKTVPCVVRKGTESAKAEMTFAENMFRKDLSPLELAAAVKDCIENKVMTVDELAAGLHRSTEWIRRMVAMLDWPADVLEVIHAEKISVSAGHNLALVDGDTYRRFLVKNAVESGATARSTAAWLQAWRSMQPMEQAVTAEPGSAESRPTPMVPQAPCLACGQVFRTDELSHVPICAGCIQAIRNAGG